MTSSTIAKLGCDFAKIHKITFFFIKAKGKEKCPWPRPYEMLSAAANLKGSECNLVLGIKDYNSIFLISRSYSRVFEEKSGVVI